MPKIPCRTCGGAGGFLVPDSNNLMTGKGWRRCTKCDGTCTEEYDNSCGECSRTGRVLQYDRFTMSDKYVTCTKCNGRGTI